MQHVTDSESLPAHVEHHSHLAGALEFSPGNADLLPPVDTMLNVLHGALGQQNQIADRANRLAGGKSVLLAALEPLTREAEVVEKGYLMSPAGKGKASMFAASAADIFGKLSHADRDAALAKIDAGLTATKAKVFEDIAKRFHPVHERYVAVNAAIAGNAKDKETFQERSKAVRTDSGTLSHKVAGQLLVRHPDDPELVDAHFRPAPKRGKKPDPEKEGEKKDEKKDEAPKDAAAPAATPAGTADEKKIA